MGWTVLARRAIHRVMPRGTLHVIEGRLSQTRRGLVLLPDGGGEWLVAPGRQRHPLLGQRVTVAGLRIGFDELWPDRIVAA